MAKRPSLPSGLTRKQLSRAKKEARLQRTVLISVGVIGALVVGLLAFAIINEQVIAPRRVIISVNENDITVAQFQERVKFDYYLQTGGQPLQQPGMESMFGQSTLDALISDLILEQKAEEMGIVVTDEEVEEEVQLAFGYDAGEPEPTNTPTPTLEGGDATPTLTPTFVYTPTLPPGVTPTATLEPTETPSEPLAATPTSTPAPTPVPMTGDEYETSFQQFLDGVYTVTGLPRDRVRELWYRSIRMQLIRKRLIAELDIEIDLTKQRTHAAHILVEDEETARELLERINNGEEFEVLAAEYSQDPSNAYKGGDLGWFGKGQMVAEFEEAAFSIPVGEISQEPVQTQFGWHLIKVYDRVEEPTTTFEQDRQRQETLREMETEWRGVSDITIADDWLDYLPSLP